MDSLTSLIDAGMNIARFNFSHGDQASHFAALQHLREALAARPEKQVAVMLGKQMVYDSFLCTLISNSLFE